jgi:hypothetical protein
VDAIIEEVTPHSGIIRNAEDLSDRPYKETYASPVYDKVMEPARNNPRKNGREVHERVCIYTTESSI